MGFCFCLAAFFFFNRIFFVPMLFSFSVVIHRYGHKRSEYSTVLPQNCHPLISKTFFKIKIIHVKTSVIIECYNVESSFCEYINRNWQTSRCVHTVVYRDGLGEGTGCCQWWRDSWHTHLYPGIFLFFSQPMSSEVSFPPLHAALHFVLGCKIMPLVRLRHKPCFIDSTEPPTRFRSPFPLRAPEPLVWTLECVWLGKTEAGNGDQPSGDWSCLVCSALRLPWICSKSVQSKLGRRHGGPSKMTKLEPCP